jgi:hypothetical protein
MSKPTYQDLVDSLRDARDLVEDWAAYAEPYFQEKWNLTGDLARIDAVIAAAETKP